LYIEHTLTGSRALLALFKPAFASQLASGENLILPPLLPPDPSSLLKEPEQCQANLTNVPVRAVPSPRLVASSSMIFAIAAFIFSILIGGIAASVRVKSLVLYDELKKIAVAAVEAGPRVCLKEMVIHV